MRIALATCATLPAWEHDDAPLHAALRAREVEVEQPIWDDPSVDWGGYDRVLLRTTWDYQAKPGAFLAWVDHVAARTRLFNPAPVIRWNTDKRYLRELELAGVAIAPTLWFERGESVELGPLVDARGIRRGFLKPVIAANSRGTLRFDASVPDERLAGQRHLDAHLVREPMMLQPYLPAVESEGELSLITFDGEFSHAVRKIPVTGDYRVQDDFGARDEPIEFDAELAAAAASTFAALATIARARGWAEQLPLLYARIDLLRAPSGELVVNELELIEPSLFFRHGPSAAERLALALLARA